MLIRFRIHTLYLSILGVKPAAPSDIAGLCKNICIQSLTFKPVLADLASWWREEERQWETVCAMFLYSPAMSKSAAGLTLRIDLCWLRVRVRPPCSFNHFLCGLRSKGLHQSIRLGAGQTKNLINVWTLITKECLSREMLPLTVEPACMVHGCKVNPLVWSIFGQSRTDWEFC